MNEPLSEISGSWEEVVAHEAELRGHQVKLVILDPTPLSEAEANTSGFKGQPITDFDAYLNSLPHLTNDNEFAAFEQAIAENRAERRCLHTASPSQSETENEMSTKQMLAEVERLNLVMQQDQERIVRAKAATETLKVEIQRSRSEVRSALARLDNAL